MKWPVKKWNIVQDETNVCTFNTSCHVRCPSMRVYVNCLITSALGPQRWLHVHQTLLTLPCRPTRGGRFGLIFSFFSLFKFPSSFLHLIASFSDFCSFFTCLVLFLVGRYQVKVYGVRLSCFGHRNESIKTDYEENNSY